MRHFGHKGFTLIEIAIVMVIIGLLTGGGISILKLLTERKARNDNLEYLQQAKEAMLSFANINGRLPYADTNTPPDGTENLNQTLGTLPFLTLNLPPTDPYKRFIKYEVNSALITDRQTICNTLLGALTGRPSVVDAEGSSASLSVAAILISSGPMDADGNGNTFDDINILGPPPISGDNTDGTPNYIKSPPVDNTIDDLVVYVGGFELYGKFCGNFTNASINNTSAVSVYVRRIAPVPPPATNVGILSAGSIATYPFTPGTQIGIYNNPSGTPPTVGSAPTTPVILAGEGIVITIP